jgi:hypothetical protein
MLYRILVDLDICKRGTIASLDHLPAANIEKLIRAECIVPLTAPPLEIFDGWQARAKRLERQGIATALQLLEADPAALARRLRVKAADIRQWQSEIEARLKEPQGE